MSDVAPIDGGRAGMLLGKYVALDLARGRNRAAGSVLAHLGMRVLRPCKAGEDELGTPLDWYENSGKEIYELAPDGDPREAIAAADIVVLDREAVAHWGISAEEASALNPRAIVTLVTPYGSAGPRAGWAASELTVQASSGQMWMAGYADRSPVPLAGSQGGYHGATQAVVGAIGALHGRERDSSAGELIDVSVQEALTNALVQSRAWWYVAGKNLNRSSSSALGGQTAVRTIWDASDGHIVWRIQLGLGDADWRMRALIEWMIGDAGIGEELREVRWGKISTLEVRAEQVLEWETHFARFFASRTRAELFAGARKHDLLLLPVLSPGEVLVDEHIVARGAFDRVTANGQTFSVPGFPVRGPGVARGRLAPVRLAGPPALPPRTGEETLPTATLRPLEGVKIMDFGWAVAGPSTGRMLGLLGATVVKVETNTRLDSTRASAPFAGRPSRDRSGYFATHNGNKLSILLNLNKPGSRDVMERLTKWADVLSENYSAGRMEAWGLGFDTLSAWNPGIVVLRSSTWGQDGPYKELPANGIVLGAYVGFGSLMGWPDRAPIVSVEPYTDMISPWFSVASIVAGLIARMETGKGLELGTSQVDTATNFLAPEYIAASLGHPPRRTGPFRCDPYPSGVFAALGDDDWCALSIESPEQWRALCGVVPGLAGSDGLEAAAIAEIAPFVFSAISAYFGARPAEETVRFLQRVHVPTSKVEKTSDVYDDPQLNYRRHFVELPHPAMGKFAYEMPSFRYRDRPIVPERSPQIGEHTGEVLGGFLGYTDDEIADMYAEGVLE